MVGDLLVSGFIHCTSPRDCSVASCGSVFSTTPILHCSYSKGWCSPLAIHRNNILQRRFSSVPSVLRGVDILFSSNEITWIWFLFPKKFAAGHSSTMENTGSIELPIRCGFIRKHPPCNAFPSPYFPPMPSN